MIDVVVPAIALVLVIEGILPCTAPKLRRETFRRMIEMNDGQIRFAGLTSRMVGWTILFLVR